MGIGMWMKFYGTQRPHSALAGLTPDEAYAGAARFSTDAAQKKEKAATTETGGLTIIEPSLIPPPGSLTNGGRLRGRTCLGGCLASPATIRAFMR
jgi:hypothetical protein